MTTPPRKTHWSFFVLMALIMLVVLTYGACINGELIKRCHDRGRTYYPSKSPICIGGK